MLQVFISMAVLLGIILIKPIPFIGGKINYALVITGAITLLMAGMFNPAEWISAWISGLNSFSWILYMSIFGCIFAEMSLRLGTIDTIVGAFAAKFGNRPRTLIVCILFTLCVAGSLLGDSIAAGTVIGMIAAGILVSMNLSLEKIVAIIAMGAGIGSVMPPMTQAVALSSTLVGADPDAVIALSYLTVGGIFILTSIYCARILVHKDNVPGANPEVEIKYLGQSASEILKKNWVSLIPLLALFFIILLRTVPFDAIGLNIGVDIGPAILKEINFITLPDGTVLSLFDWLSKVTILSGLTTSVVPTMICAICVAMLFPVVHRNLGEIIPTALSKVKTTLLLQMGCAFMVGSFYAAGSIETVSTFCQQLDSNVLKIGGGFALILMGMLTGSQSTAQNSVFAFFGPALVTGGMGTTAAALAGSHLAAAGQGLPPADLLTFVICGIVSAQFGRKVDPMKAMIYSAPMCIMFAIVGFIAMYI